MHILMGRNWHVWEIAQQQRLAKWAAGNSLACLESTWKTRVLPRQLCSHEFSRELFPRAHSSVERSVTWENLQIQKERAAVGEAVAQSHSQWCSVHSPTESSQQCCQVDTISREELFSHFTETDVRRGGCSPQITYPAGTRTRLETWKHSSFISPDLHENLDVDSQAVGVWFIKKHKPRTPYRCSVSLRTKSFSTVLHFYLFYLP